MRSHVYLEIGTGGDKRLDMARITYLRQARQEGGSPQSRRQGRFPFAALVLGQSENVDTRAAPFLGKCGILRGLKLQAAAPDVTVIDPRSFAQFRGQRGKGDGAKGT